MRSGLSKVYKSTDPRRLQTTRLTAYLLCIGTRPRVDGHTPGDMTSVLELIDLELNGSESGRLVM